MKVLLDTNIVIHRETNKVFIDEIGILFNWLDNLKFEKCLHPASLLEFEKHKDAEIVRTIKLKANQYNVLKTESAEVPAILELRKSDKSDNDKIDTSILKELLNNRVEYIITEDRGIHRKALVLGLEKKVFTIDSFLSKVRAENPDLVDYKVLSVKKEYFGNVDLTHSFFDSFKEDYKEFEVWFNKKADNISYVCLTDGNVKAFLFVKIEEKTEPYHNVSPPFPPKRRMKIGTFKVTSTGFKLGERFLKIIFDNAILFNVDEIYVTLFDKRPEQKLLINLLEDWGFYYWGVKTTDNGEEKVFVKDFSKKVDIKNAKLTFPFVSRQTKKFIVPIYPEYHTNLFPDSILNNESPADFVENEPYRNAIQKVYISRSYNRKLSPGDLIVFYRTGGIYQGVVSTIGVVENIITDIKDETEFVELCRKRSVFSDKDLKAHWNYNPKSRPFIVNFLYVYSLPKRINLKNLIDLGVISDVTCVPRGFELIDNVKFEKILKASKANENYFVD